jgi:lysophospholipase L1-like esterase
VKGKKIFLFVLFTASLSIAIAAGYYLCGPFSPAPKPFSILCIGDSLTQSKYGSYIPALETQLLNAGIDATVHPAARPGNTSGEYRRFLSNSTILEETNPGLVVIMLGTNDVRTDGDRTPLLRFVQNMRVIIHRIKKHRNPDGSTPQILLATIPPIFSIDIDLFNEQSKTRIAKEIVPAIKDLARTETVNIVDVHAYFLNKKTVVPGIHLNKRGYELLGKQIYKHIHPIIKGSEPRGEERLPNGFTGKIAFQSDRSGNEDIYIINRDGVRQITNSPAFDGYPALSPDGTRVAFESNRSGRFEIYLADMEGRTNPLIVSEGDNKAPFWSHSGSYLYFARRKGRNQNIFRYNFNSRATEQVTDFGGTNALPTVSANGEYLMTTGKNLLGWNLYLIKLSNLEKKIFADGYKGCRAKFSHTGRRVVFVSHKFDGKGDIFISAIDNTSLPQRLTLDAQHHDYYPTFSPDDRYIAYASGPQLKSGNWDIKIMELASGKTWTITSSPAADRFPSWSKD